MGSWMPKQVDVRDTYQFTPLHSAANGGHCGTIARLIAFGHDVDVKDYLGVPLLFLSRLLSTSGRRLAAAAVSSAEAALLTDQNAAAECLDAGKCWWVLPLGQSNVTIEGMLWAVS
jgi:hypothetical protein